jgi:NO-binding membrane sensor protein with MHYT domain
VWTRPQSLLVLGVVGAAMVLFAALDVREVFHQVDESRAGLAVLAGAVAALHLGAAAAIGLLARGTTPA